MRQIFKVIHDHKVNGQIFLISLIVVNLYKQYLKRLINLFILYIIMAKCLLYTAVITKIVGKIFVCLLGNNVILNNFRIFINLVNFLLHNKSWLNYCNQKGNFLLGNLCFVVFIPIHKLFNFIPHLFRILIILRTFL